MNTLSFRTASSVLAGRQNAPVFVDAVPLDSHVGGFHLELVARSEVLETARGEPKRFATLDSCYRFLARCGQWERVVFVLQVQVGHWSDWEGE